MEKKTLASPVWSVSEFNDWFYEQMNPPNPTFVPFYKQPCEACDNTDEIEHMRMHCDMKEINRKCFETLRIPKERMTA